MKYHRHCYLLHLLVLWWENEIKSPFPAMGRQTSDQTNNLPHFLDIVD